MAVKRKSKGLDTSPTLTRGKELNAYYKENAKVREREVLAILPAEADSTLGLKSAKEPTYQKAKQSPAGWSTRHFLGQSGARPASRLVDLPRSARLGSARPGPARPKWSQAGWSTLATAVGREDPQGPRVRQPRAQHGGDSRDQARATSPPAPARPPWERGRRGRPATPPDSRPRHASPPIPRPSPAGEEGPRRGSGGRAQHPEAGRRRQGRAPVFSPLSPRPEGERARVARTTNNGPRPAGRRAAATNPCVEG